MGNLVISNKTLPVPWDYLIVTASNDEQGRAYESQLAIRRKLGLLTDLAEVMVVIDPQGKRIGSGGSTVPSRTSITTGSGPASMCCQPPSQALPV